MSLNMLEVEEIVRRALGEDIGTGDITTALTIPPGSVSRARIVARESGVIAGLDVAALVFAVAGESCGSSSITVYRKFRARPVPLKLTREAVRKLSGRSAQYTEFSLPIVPHSPFGGRGRSITFQANVADGDEVEAGATIAEVTGPTSVILTGERVALNFLQRMSGIATKTSRLAKLIAHTDAQVVDTRKTTPGLRILEKYAVRMGGGGNHRFGLYDAVLIKDNHIQAAGGIREAILAARSGAPHTIKIEVEADTIEQVRQALDAGAEMILLDNMSVETLREAVSLCKGRALTEASGGVTEESIAGIAETGVDLISVGALTHSVKALDLSLDII